MFERSDITPALLRRLISYCPETGELTWRVRAPAMFAAGKKSAAHQCRVWNAKYAGCPALSSESGGYLRGSIGGISVKAHRAAWAIYHGEWPHSDLDHINHNGTDNRIVNLRCVTPSQNAKNQKLRTTNKSGKMGVSWDSSNNKWMAMVVVDGQSIFLGRFCEKQEAIDAKSSAEVAHGFHEMHGAV